MGKGLTRESVIAAALEVLDQTGLDGLTMRALATHLQVKAPALYWHFSDKQDLADEMATALWREVQHELPAPGADWRENMVAFAGTLRTVLLRHRDGATLFSGTYLTDVAVLEAQEKPLAAFVASGVPLETAVQVSNVLYNFTIGSCIEEQAVRQVSAVDDRYDLAERGRRLDAQRFPLMTAAGQLVFGNQEQQFVTTVRRLVAVFEHWDD
jgi:TetR/AcrR family tetracycline transcriptional repressor